MAGNDKAAFLLYWIIKDGAIVPPIVADPDSTSLPYLLTEGGGRILTELGAPILYDEA